MARFGFHLKEKGTNWKTEIIAGAVMFLVVIYLIPTNASIMSASGMDQAAVYVASALASFLSTFLFAIITNAPLILATGMGLNSLFAYTMVQQLGYSWQQGMFIVFLAGIVYFIISITPLRTIILNAFPENLKRIVSACLGAFIAFSGLMSAGVFKTTESGLLSMGDLSSPSVILALGGIVMVLVLAFVKTKRGLLNNFAVPLTMLVVASIGLIMAYSGVNDAGLPRANFDQGWGVSSLSETLFFGALAGDPNYSFGSIVGNVFSNPLTYVLIFSIVFANMLNSAAVFMLIGRDAGILNEEGKVKSNSYMFAEAVGGLSSGLLGCAPISSIAETQMGLNMGAKTGLSVLTTSLLLLVSAFLYPIFSIFVYGSVTSCALVYIGVLIFMNNLSGLEIKKPEVAVSLAFAILFVIGSYSLSNGMGIAMITYILVELLMGKYKEIHPLLYAFSAVYLANFVLEAVFF